jgi:hypothetical protein
MANIVSSHKYTQCSGNCQRQDVIPGIHVALIGVSDDAIPRLVDACLCDNTRVCDRIITFLGPVTYFRVRNHPFTVHRYLGNTAVNSGMYGVSNRMFNVALSSLICQSGKLARMLRTYDFDLGRITMKGNEW